MPKRPITDNEVQVTIRMPKALKRVIEKLAVDERRSFNAQAVRSMEVGLQAPRLAR